MGGELVGYIKEQLNNGFTRWEIEEHLIRSGYSRKEVEKAFQKAISKKIEITKTIIEVLSILLLALLVLIVGLSSESPGLNVIAGFLPSLLSLLFFISVVETKRHTQYVWVMPLVFVILFVILGVTNISLFGEMEIYKLALLNIVISYIALLLVSYPDIYETTEHTEKPEELKKIEHEFSTIEDKCKAINFVIGRVYRSSNGGTTKMRDEIRISSDIYNEFQRAVKEGTKEEQIAALEKIEKALLKLKKTEREVFGDFALKHLKNILRNEDGSSRIIDVLAKNDNDPVMIYYQGALESYNELRKKIELG
ncbi:MAG: hypothetical protein QXG86_01700 [Candidatus Woesearchaeota archaeon]